MGFLIPHRRIEPICVHLITSHILGDPGADKGGEGKAKRAEKNIYGKKKSKERRELIRAPGDNVLPDQFQTVAAVLVSDWC